MKRIFSRVGLGITLFLVVQQILVMIIQLLLNMYAPDILETDWINWIIAYVPLYFVGFPVLLLVYRTIPDSTGGFEEKKKYTPLNVILIFCACLAITLVLNLFSTFLSSLIEILKGSEVTNMLAETTMNSNPWINLFMVALVAPVMEEIIFRRLLYNKLIVFGGPVYILVSAMMFALFHVNFYQLLYAFVLGVIFAAITYYSGTIRYSVILHILLNFFANGVSMLLQSYASETVQIVHSSVLLMVGAIGIIITVWWIIKRRKLIEFAPAEVSLHSKKIIFQNPGMALYLLILGILIVIALLM